MANLLAGFVKGFADNQVDQIQERRKLENEEKKAKMLADLQRETAQANFLFEKNFERSNKVDENMSTVDYETGDVTQVALDGTVLGKRKLTAAEREKHRRGEEGAELDIAGKKQAMADSTARLGLEQQRVQISKNEAAERRAERLARLDGSSDFSDPKFKVAEELIGLPQFKSKINAILSGYPEDQRAIIRDQMLNTAATAADMGSKTGTSPQDRFQKSVQSLATQLDMFKQNP